MCPALACSLHQFSKNYLSLCSPPNCCVALPCIALLNLCYFFGDHLTVKNGLHGQVDISTAATASGVNLIGKLIDPPCVTLERYDCFLSRLADYCGSGRVHDPALRETREGEPGGCFIT